MRMIVVCAMHIEAKCKVHVTSLQMVCDMHTRHRAQRILCKSTLHLVQSDRALLTYLRDALDEALQSKEGLSVSF